MSPLIYRGDGSPGFVPPKRPRRKPTRPRDVQRSRVYYAERDAFRALPRDHRARRLYPEIADVRRRLDAILRSAWMRKHYPSVARRWAEGWIAVLPTGGRGAASAGRHELSFSRPARQEWVILHELAHTVIMHDHPDAAHDWRWAACYLALVRRFLGTPEADMLRAAFKVHRVRYSAPRKGRVLTEAEKDALRERLATARATKAADAALTRVAASIVASGAH